MCYQNALEIFLSLKENFSNTTTFTVMDNFGKGSAIQIATVFRPIFIVVCLRVL